MRSPRRSTSWAARTSRPSSASRSSAQAACTRRRRGTSTPSATICRDRGVLFVADEVITGYGRTGRMFASEGLEPDLVLTAKGLTSGYLPMGAVLVAGSVAEPFWHDAGLPLAARLHVLGPCSGSRRRDGQPRHHRGRAARASASPVCSSRSRPRWCRCAGHEYVVDVRSGAGLLGAVTARSRAAGGGPDAHAARARRHARAGRAHPRPRRRLGADLAARSSSRATSCGQIASAIDGALTAAGSTRAASPAAESGLLPDVTSDEAGGFGSTRCAPARRRAAAPRRLSR